MFEQETEDARIVVREFLQQAKLKKAIWLLLAALQVR